MAKALQASPKNKVAWVLIILLILGLAGFGIGGFSTSVRAVGSVGDQEISVDEYVRALQQRMAGYSQQFGTSLTTDQAIRFGIDREVLEALFLRATVDNEANRIGISVSDETVLNRLYSMPEFFGADDKFDRASYDFLLERSGLTEAELDQQIRDEETRNILAASVSGGFAASQTYQERMIEYRFSTRDITWTALGIDQLPEAVPEPTSAQLREFYDSNPELFTRPELKELTHVSLTPGMLADPAEIAEEALRAEYENRISTYNVPERRNVNRLVFPDRQQADEAKTRLDDEEITFDELLAERGIQLPDTELGDVSRSDLGSEAASLLFAGDDVGVYGPVNSALGPAIFRVNAVLAGRLTRFEEARDELAAALAEEEGRNRIAENVVHYEDLLAGGASLEELAADTDFRLSSMTFDGNPGDGVAGQPVFLAAVSALGEDDVGGFPELADLPDGGLFAIRLDNIVPPALQPFDQVAGEVEEAWRQERAEQLLREHADELRSSLESGSTFEELGLVATSDQGIRRTGNLAGSPPGMVQELFELAIGEFAVSGDGGLLAIARLDAISPADMESEEVESAMELLALRSELGTGADAYQLYSRFLQEETGIDLDHATIESIHAQLP